MNRHGKLMTGYPVITGPVSDTVIHTSAENIDCGSTWISVSDVDGENEEIPAYFAKPEGAGQFPILLVIQEVFGCDDYLQDTCRRAAKEGLFAVAVELYARQGEPGKAKDRESLFSIVGSAADSQVMGDLDAATSWAVNNGGNASKLSCTGFCWGGRIAWLYAAHNPELKAGVAWYGRLEGETSANQPAYPLDLAADLKAPVLGLYGENDEGIPLASVDKMKAALEEVNEASKIIVYPNAPHAFHADYRPSFVAEAAEDGWQKLLDWLSAHDAR